MKRKLTILVILAFIVSTSFAYFTDRTSGNVSSKAGTVCIELLKKNYDLDNIAPGDKRSVEFEYKNTGSLAIDTRITYILNYESDHDGNYENVLNLYDGDLILQKKSNDYDRKATLTSIEEGVLLPNESKTKKLELELDSYVTNEVQDSEITLEIIVEGKQLNSPDWEELSTQVITIKDGEYYVVAESNCMIMNGPDNSVEPEAENKGPNGSNDEDIEAITEMFHYEELEDGYRIAGIDGRYYNDVMNGEMIYELAIPDTYKGKPVTHVGFNREDLSKYPGMVDFSLFPLTKLKLGENVEVIECSAFYLAQLEELYIPDSVKVIKQTAFANSNLKTLRLGTSLETIEADAFWGIQHLNELRIGENVKLIEPYAINYDATIENLYIHDNATNLMLDGVTGTNLYINKVNGDSNYQYRTGIYADDWENIYPYN